MADKEDHQELNINLTSPHLVLTSLCFVELPVWPLKAKFCSTADLYMVRRNQLIRIFNRFINGTIGIATWALTSSMVGKEVDKYQVAGLPRYINRRQFNSDSFHLTGSTLNDM